MIFIKEGSVNITYLLLVVHSPKDMVLPLLGLATSYRSYLTHTLIDHEGRIRLDLEKRFQWTDTIFMDADFTFRQKQTSEFESTLMYQNNWSWATGLMFTKHSAGVGGHYSF